MRTGEEGGGMVYVMNSEGATMEWKGGGSWPDSQTTVWFNVDV